MTRVRGTCAHKSTLAPSSECVTAPMPTKCYPRLQNCHLYFLRPLVCLPTCCHCHPCPHPCLHCPFTSCHHPHPLIRHLCPFCLRIRPPVRRAVHGCRSSQVTHRYTRGNTCGSGSPAEAHPCGSRYGFFCLQVNLQVPAFYSFFFHFVISSFYRLLSVLSPRLANI